MEKDIRFPDLFFRQRLNAVGIPMLLSVSLFVFFSDWSALFLFAFGIFALVFTFFSKGERRKTLLCVLAGVSLSLLVCGALGIEEKHMEKFVGNECLAEGYVISAEEDSFDLALIKFDKKPFFKTFRVEGGENIRQGDRIRIFLMPKEISPQKDRSEGIFCLATACREEEKVGKSLVYSFVFEVRETLLEGFLQEEEGGFLAAIILGDRSKIDFLKEDFEKTASQHILAISGLHISQFIGFFVAALQFLPVGRSITRILLFPLVGILFLLGGGGISVFRAGFMTLFSISALLARRRGDSVTSLVFAASVLVMTNPYTVENYSFLFSFLSTFALVFCAVPLSDCYAAMILEKKEKTTVFTKILAGVVSSFTTASAVFVFLLPLQILLMGEVQLFSPLYALILIPLFQICLITALVGSLLVFLPVSIPFLWESVCSIQKGFLGLVSALADASPPLFRLGKWSVPVALFFAILLIFSFAKKEKIAVIYRIHLVSFLTFSFLYLFFL